MTRDLQSSYESKSPIVTFYGPDGCGKTTLAEYATQANEHADQDTLLVGGSTYLEWLTPDVYKHFFKSSERYDRGTANNASPEERTALYEDIAVCLYGVADHFSRTRGSVYIHSDPYLKRLTWAKTRMDEVSFWQYADRFEDYVGSHIANIFASHVAVIHTDPEENFRRIISRGMVSDYDPATIDENTKIAKAVDFISRTLLDTEQTYDRLQSAVIAHFDNPTTQHENIPDNLSKIAKRVDQFVKGV